MFRDVSSYRARDEQTNVDSTTQGDSYTKKLRPGFLLNGSIEKIPWNNALRNNYVKLAETHAPKMDLRQVMYEANHLLKIANDELANISHNINRKRTLNISKLNKTNSRSKKVLNSKQVLTNSYIIRSKDNSKSVKGKIFMFMFRY